MSSSNLSATVSPFSGALARVPNTSSSDRMDTLFVGYEQRVFAQTNKLFWWLLVVQWAFAMMIATVWSPRAWEGEESTIHPHLLAAIFLGALQVLPPLLLMRLAPYHWLTRHAVAI